MATDPNIVLYLLTIVIVQQADAYVYLQTI